MLSLTLARSALWKFRYLKMFGSDLSLNICLDEEAKDIKCTDVKVVEEARILATKMYEHEENRGC